ncbi:MAG: peroxidase-related enzyme [Candidatus Acidiferrales bacterium]
MQSVDMKPMFLPGVQNNPQPGPYFDMIKSAQDSGREYWQIWHLFAFVPETTTHLAHFTQGIMRGPAPITPALRELIATYVSHLNQCEFCMKAHAAVSAELLGSEDLVASVLGDVESSPLPANEKVLLRFARKVTLDLPNYSAVDAERVRAAGWSDEAIFNVITVCALFNFYNRWVTASGVHAVSKQGHRSHGKVLAQNGYVRKQTPSQHP